MRAAPRRVAPFKLVQRTGNSITLRSPAALMEIRALAPDLFRLRIARGKRFSQHPSWAVVNEAPLAAPEAGVAGRGESLVKISAHRAAIHTSAAQLRVDLATGAWQLGDHQGHVLFTAAPPGFKGTQSHVTLELKEGEKLFGLGETTGTFDKRGLIREFWNIDVLGHAAGIHPCLRHLYDSIPFGISLRAGRAAGLFWDNPARQAWDLGQTHLDRWVMMADAGEIDLYLFTGPSVASVVSRYTELTGRMPLPPRWALGYQQSRYSYKTRARVEEVARTFRRKQIPCDVLHLDIHHMRGYRVFTFGSTFPQPAQMLAKLKRQGFHVVTIVDPGVKDDPQFGVLRRGRAGRHFVKKPRGNQDILGKVWPGLARFPDFLNAPARKWWGEEQSALQTLGVAGFWNDMNEPAAFDQPGKTLPAQCQHKTDHGTQLHSAVHNLYGMQMARASYEGALAHAPNQRPFIITRAGYAGTQRYALIWTGDNSSTWEHLADSVPMLLNLSLSGVPFCGADAGGFLDSTTGELLGRWMQLAAFTPFFRNHSDLHSRAQEPWAFGPRVEAVCRRAIELRYRLLSYLYCLFAEAHRQGTPIMRPMLWHYQDDPRAAGAGDQFLLGPDLLVAPILRQGAVARSVYLPRGPWYNFHTGEKLAGGRPVLAEATLEQIPLFVRAGAIIPMAPVLQFTDEKPIDTIDLHVWLGGKGSLEWYEDDGATQQYGAGDFSQRVIRLASDARGATLIFGKPQGRRASAIKSWRVILHGAVPGQRISVDGKSIKGRWQAGRVCEFELGNSALARRVRLAG